MTLYNVRCTFDSCGITIVTAHEADTPHEAACAHLRRWYNDDPDDDPVHRAYGYRFVVWDADEDENDGETLFVAFDDLDDGGEQ